jgi:predicted GH43/DUF377 family glycosyl hydrolase
VWRLWAVLVVLAGALAWGGSAHASTVIPRDAPDPALLRVGNWTYAYTTSTGRGASAVLVPVWRSGDLGRWELIGDALRAPGRWADPAPGIWAPSVTAVPGGYAMAYSAFDRVQGSRCVGVALAPSPTGPFLDRRAGPLVCATAPNDGVIDPAFFTAPDGRLWLHYKATGSSGRQIWAVPLSGDASSLAGTPRVILNATQSWEQGGVENPHMVATSSGLVLLYSGGPWWTASYAIGVATCDSPAGPCRSIGRLLGTDDERGIVGPGGASVVSDGAGGHWMGYHAWVGGVGYGSGGVRALAVDRLSLTSWTPPPPLSELPPNLIDLLPRPLPTPVVGPVGAASGLQVTTDASFPAPARDGPNEPDVAQPPAAVVVPPGTCVPTPAPAAVDGYWSLSTMGELRAFGSVEGLPRATVTRSVAVVSAGGGRGAWVMDAAGRVDALGTASWFGDAPDLPRDETAVALLPTNAGDGYLVVTSRGRVLSFGSAQSFGDMAALTLNGPVVGAGRTSSGCGYWLVGSDGGIFAFGDAQFYGSTGGMRLNQPVIGVVSTPSNAGYWLVATDGGVFSFGDAVFRGSLGSMRLNAPISGMVRYGEGYLLTGQDGGVFTFSDRPFAGSSGSDRISSPVVAIASG